MLDETPQTTPTVRAGSNMSFSRRFSENDTLSAVAARLSVMLPRAASGGVQNKEHLSPEEHIEARALAERYPSSFSILHPVFCLQSAETFS